MLSNFRTDYKLITVVTNCSVPRRILGGCLGRFLEHWSMIFLCFLLFFSFFVVCNKPTPFFVPIYTFLAIILTIWIPNSISSPSYDIFTIWPHHLLVSQFDLPTFSCDYSHFNTRVQRALALVSTLSTLLTFVGLSWCSPLLVISLIRYFFLRVSFVSGWCSFWWSMDNGVAFFFIFNFGFLDGDEGWL